MMATPDILRDDGAQNLQPPFSNAQLNESATHREILNIYQHARPETKPLYDMGRDTQGLEEENWVIRWLLWHVFRYRDNRNKNRRQGSPAPSSSENSSSESQPKAGTGMFAFLSIGYYRQLRSITGSTGNSTMVKAYYDPVRDT
jgi:hypothetical protein